MSAQVMLTVPATTANLGPGFDSIGLALDIRDRITASVVESGVTVSISGNGADSLPNDETHLIAKVALDAAQQWGQPLSGLAIECQNNIPQGRGFGSSAAAIIAGLVIARELTGTDVSDAQILQQANVIEGHPDNISACLFGGLTVNSWTSLDDVQSVSLPVHKDVVVVMGIPQAELNTHKARGLLPDTVPYEDAIFNASRSALLIAAMTSHPEQLMSATADRLHQNYRKSAYSESFDIVSALRTAGIGGAISGAGPSVIALTTSAQAQAATDIISGGGFQARQVAISSIGVQVLS